MISYAVQILAEVRSTLEDVIGEKSGLAGFSNSSPLSFPILVYVPPKWALLCLLILKN